MSKISDSWEKLTEVLNDKETYDKFINDLGDLGEIPDELLKIDADGVIWVSPDVSEAYEWAIRVIDCAAQTEEEFIIAFLKDGA